MFGYINNAVILSLMVYIFYVMGYKLTYLSLFIFLHSVLMFIYNLFFTINKRITIFEVRRNPKFIVVVFNYLVVVQYNNYFNIFYNFLKKIKPSGWQLVGFLIKFPIRVLAVVLLGMPYRILLLCKVLILATLQCKVDPYMKFLCELNTLIVNPHNNRCIYHIKGAEFHTNGLIKIIKDKVSMQEVPKSFYIKSVGSLSKYHRGMVCARDSDGSDIIAVRTTKHITWDVPNLPTNLFTKKGESIYINFNIFRKDFILSDISVQPSPEEITQMHCNALSYAKLTAGVNILAHTPSGITTYSRTYNQFIKSVDKKSYLGLINSVIESSEGIHPEC